MGIYSNGKVYGVCWSLYDEELCEYVPLLEHTYREPLNALQIQYIQTKYDLLTEEKKNCISIQFYTCCATSYEADSGASMMWWPGSRTGLEELFEKGEITRFL